jgi:hypothetical protein
MDKTDLILYRLDEQNKAAESSRQDVKDALRIQQEKSSATFERVFEQFKLIDGRLTSVEKWRYTIGGAIAVVGVLVTWLVTLKAATGK